MDGTERNKIIIIAAAVAVLALLAFFIFTAKRGANGNGAAGTGVSNASSSGPSSPVTKEAVPANVVVPGQNAKDVPANVAVPKQVASGSPTGDVSYRSFAIKADGGKFTPDTVIVKLGDTIDINITAVDKEYDFTQPDFGFNLAIPKGATKKVQFGGTTTGKFLFYCSLCGGPSHGPTGYVIVAPK